MKRYQSRLGNGRFTPNTTENCFGLRTIICPSCRAINPYGRKVKERKRDEIIDPVLFNQWDVPTHCHACGVELPQTEVRG